MNKKMIIKNLKHIYVKKYPVNTKKTRYNQNNKLKICPTKKYLSK